MGYKSGMVAGFGAQKGAKNGKRASGKLGHENPAIYGQSDGTLDFDLTPLPFD